MILNLFMQIKKLMHKEATYMYEIASITIAS